MPGKYDFLAMELLKAVLKHRTVVLLEYVISDFDDVVWRYADYVRVVCAVMDLAEREAVRYDRLAARLAVGNDVRGVKELGVLDVADGTVVAIGVEYHHAEGLLM